MRYAGRKKSGVGYAIFVGGKMGKRPRLGDRLPFEIEDGDKVLATIDKAIDWYAENGTKGERFGATIDRVGLEHLVGALESVL